MEKAIYAAYGIQFRDIPADGKLRRFKIGYQEGYALLLDGAGVFGNWNSGEYYEWNGTIAIKSEFERPQTITTKQLREEEVLVAIGDAAFDAGNPLQSEDLDRYILALTRVIEAKNGRR